MKQPLDWKSKEVVNIYDEVSLWSAPFGRLLLENIPMKAKANLVDIGFGTGFPLIELSQRFGEQSKIYGIDIWQEAILRTKEKIKVLGINNIEIIEESATKINIRDQQIDLVTSNLGINNFEQKERVYAEVNRILKQGGKLCITTNPIGTFAALFEVFDVTFKEMKLEEEQHSLKKYIKHRNSKEEIISEIEKSGFKLSKNKSDTTNIRFVDGEALMDHGLIRIGFKTSWKNMIQTKRRTEFFERVIQKINIIIKSKGEFILSIPMLYLEFERV